MGTGVGAGAGGSEFEVGVVAPETTAGVDDAGTDVVGDGARPGTGARIEAKDEGDDAVAVVSVVLG